MNNRADFITEFSSGRYQAYLLIKGKQRLGPRLAKALREAVNRGEGLVMFARQHFYRHQQHNQSQQNGRASQHARHSALAEVFGVGLRRHQRKTRSLHFIENNPLNLQGVIQFIEQKQGHTLALKQAQAVMRYSMIDDAYEQCHNQDYGQGYDHYQYGNEENGQSDDAEDHHNHNQNPHCHPHNWHHNRHNTAISFNRYGKGRALYAGFDVLAYAAQYQDKILLSDLINQALEKTHPVELALLPSSAVPIDITLHNRGSNAHVRATLTASINTAWLSVSEGNIADTKIIWQAQSPGNSEHNVSAWLQLPTTGGEIAITLLLEAGLDANKLITQENLSINLSVPPSVMLSDIIEQIKALQTQNLQVRGHHQPFLKKALNKLKKAKKHEQNNRLSRAATFALAAIDKLTNKTDPAIIDIRLHIDDWLRLATLRDGGQWCCYMDDNHEHDDHEGADD